MGVPTSMLQSASKVSEGGSFPSVQHLNIKITTGEDKYILRAWPLQEAVMEAERRPASKSSMKGSTNENDERKELGKHDDEKIKQLSRHPLKDTAGDSFETPNEDIRDKQHKTLRRRTKSSSLRDESLHLPTRSSPSIPDDSSSSATLFHEDLKPSRDRDQFNCEALASSLFQASPPKVEANTPVVMDRCHWQHSRSPSLESHGYTRFPSLNDMQYQYRVWDQARKISRCKTCGKTKRNLVAGPTRNRSSASMTPSTYSYMDRARRSPHPGYSPPTLPSIDQIVLSPPLPIRSR